ncbi:MAG: hypothetical protein RL722_1317 [Pseudomonadota bacterium]|jgi:tRNA threonylcarbamoyladenosine biosynthesis protein TsaB
MSPGLIALDASTDRVELVLSRHGKISSRTLGAGADASRQVLPALQGLLADAGMTLADITAFAYGAGPGAFTGLRTACAITQGLAFGTGKPVLALDTLAVVAEASWAEAGVAEVWAVLDARMGEVYAAPYRRLGPGRWQALAAAALYRPEALRDGLAPGARMAGPGVAAYAELRDSAAALAVPARPAGAAMLALAQAAWGDEARLDPAAALPVYVRDKVAQTTAERQAAKAAAAVSAAAELLA